MVCLANVEVALASRRRVIRLRHLHGGVLCVTAQGILPRTVTNVLGHLQPSGVVYEVPGPIRTSLVLEGTEEGLTSNCVPPKSPFELSECKIAVCSVMRRDTVVSPKPHMGI